MKRGQVYKCTETGIVIEVINGGDDHTLFQEQDMRPLLERTSDAGNEKHVPVVEKTADGILVKVGSVPHPMEEDHWIQWIEVIAKDAVYRKYLNPGNKPEATFPPLAGSFVVRELCNKHGLWKA